MSKCGLVFRVLTLFWSSVLATVIMLLIVQFLVLVHAPEFRCTSETPDPFET